LARFEGLAEDDRDGRIARVLEFLGKHDDTVVAARARQLLKNLRASKTPPADVPAPTAKRDEKPQPPAEADAKAAKKGEEKSPQALPPPLAGPRPKPHQAAFDKHLDALFAALREKGPEASMPIAERAAQDATLGDWADAGKERTWRT
jgi:hypothetical protein